MIEKAIKERMKKEIKEIKKLYQATIDGDEPSIFHKKCDNIPNTLILYKSAGQRRFEDLLLNVGIQMDSQLWIKTVSYFL